MTIHEITCPYLGQFVKSFVIETENQLLFLDGGLHDQKERYGAFLDSPKPKAILNTHGHWDHTGLVADLRAMGAPLYAHAADRIFYRDFPFHWQYVFGQFWNTTAIPEERKSIFADGIGSPSEIDREVNDGDTLHFDGVTLEVMHTPGHSPGSVCFYEPTTGTLFTGDTLMGSGFFRGGPLYADPVAYVASMHRLASCEVERVCSAHNEIAPGSVLAEKAKLAIEIDGIIGETVKAAWESGDPSLTVGGLADRAAAAIGRGSGCGMCVTVTGYLQLLAQTMPAVQAILKGFSVSVPKV